MAFREDFPQIFRLDGTRSEENSLQAFSNEVAYFLNKCLSFAAVWSRVFVSENKKVCRSPVDFENLCQINEISASGIQSRNRFFVCRSNNV